MRPTHCSNSSPENPPRSRIASRTAIAFTSAKASSCAGVAPASCRWYEQMFEAFHFGTWRRQYSYMSTMSRIDGRGGKMYVPRARYSLMMSFCVVPWRRAGSTPCSSASAT
jgi:hypothetical protein